MQAAEPSPRARKKPPAFVRLSVSAALTFSSFISTLPFLPLLLRSSNPVPLSSLAIALFFSPALVLNPLIPALDNERLVNLFPLPPLLSCLSAVLLIFSTSHYLLLLLASLLAGVSFFSLQAALPALVHFSLADLPDALRQTTHGLHLAFLEACIAFATIISPPLYVIFARHTSVRLLYFCLSVAHAALGLAAFLALPSFARYPHYAPIPPTSAILRLHAEQDARRRRSVSPSSYLRPLLRPWVAFVLFAMFALSAALAATRPLLTAYLLPTDAPSEPPSLRSPALMPTASLFSLVTLTTALTDSLVPGTLAQLLGLRTTLVLGLSVCALGFHLLPAPHPVSQHHSLAAPLSLVATGASAGLVVALADLSQTTGLPLNPPSEQLVVLAAVLLGAGDVAGSLLPAAFMRSVSASAPQVHDFEAALQFVKHATVVAAGVVLVPYTVTLLVQWIAPVVTLFAATPFPRPTTGNAPV